MSNQIQNITASDLAVMYSSEFTKKQAIETGQKLVADLFEAGEVDELKVFSNIVRLKEVVNAADKAFRERINIPSATTSNGVEFTPKNGAKKLQYIEDPIYVSLVEAVKSREELLKVAHNSKDVIFDSDGCEVPKVSAKFDSSSITVKF